LQAGKHLRCLQKSGIHVNEVLHWSTWSTWRLKVLHWRRLRVISHPQCSESTDHRRHNTPSEPLTTTPRRCRRWT